MAINFDLKKYINPVFVETGTYMGNGIESALSAGFEEIFSIEISPTFHKKATARFQKQIKQGKVNIILGDSSVCLTSILEKLHYRATFWLDAHFSGGDTGKGSKDVALLEELDAISKHPIKDHTILIDDVRLFGTKQGEDWSGVTLCQVLEKLKTIDESYQISYENGVVERDVLVAMPSGDEAGK
jgi:hypothetical protein